MFTRNSKMLTIAATFALNGVLLAADGPLPPQAPSERGAGGSDTNNAAMLSDNKLTVSTESTVEQIRQIGQSNEKVGDKLFAMHVGASNAWEIQFSDLVAARTQDPKVRELAKMVADDHRKNQDELRPIADSLGVKTSNQLSPEKQAKLGVLAQLPPDKLDQCYLASQKAAHAGAITSFSDQQQLSQDGQVKAYITQTLPKLKAHGQHILSVAATKGLSGEYAISGPESTQQPLEAGRSVKPDNNAPSADTRDNR